MDEAKEFKPRGGAVRHKDSETGKWVETNPGDPLYSLATFMMEEYFDGEQWKSFDELGK